MPDEYRLDFAAVHDETEGWSHQGRRGDNRTRYQALVAWERPYKVGDTRAVMIEGPGREALKLVDKK